MIPEKAAPDLIWGGSGFSDKIMLERKCSGAKRGLDLAVEQRVDRVLWRRLGAVLCGREVAIDDGAGARHQRAQPLRCRLRQHAYRVVRAVALEPVARL